MEELTSEQITLVVREALAEEPAAASCHACGEIAELDWEFTLVCPACGAEHALPVRVVRWHDGHYVSFNPAEGTTGAVAAEIARALTQARAEFEGNGVIATVRDGHVNAQAILAARPARP